MYCKDLNSFPVLSLFEGELIGKVDKLYFDKKLKKLIEIELIGEDCSKLVLPTKNIYHVGKNAITVKNNLSVSLKNLESENCVAPIGAKAYTINGELLGVVQEICFDEKFFTTKILLENEKLINVEKLASCGKNTLIFNDETSKINLKSFTPSKTPNDFKAQTTQVVLTMPKEENQPNVEEIEKPKIKTNNSDFLIGRVCTKNIFNFNNEVLIKERDVVTKKVLKEITKFGKLRELMIYTK